MEPGPDREGASAIEPDAVNDIEAILETDPPDRGMRQAVREAVRRHRLLGYPITVIRDGEVVWVPPEEIEVPPPERAAGLRLCGEARHSTLSFGTMEGRMMTRFERFVGIDYSGAGEPSSPMKGIQVYAADEDEPPRLVRNPEREDGRWSRRDLSYWLIDELRNPRPTIVGLDHAFSLPHELLGHVASWEEFLRWFTARWRTHERSVQRAVREAGLPSERQLFRLADRWTSSAKSIFARVGPGVFHSTFAGIPWLLKLREARGNRLHFWPADGWRSANGSSVVAEVYPALFKRRYESPAELTPDMKDAFAVCSWLQDMSFRGALEGYFEPPLTDEEKAHARLEGWILGVT